MTKPRIHPNVGDFMYKSDMMKISQRQPRKKFCKRQLLQRADCLNDMNMAGQLLLMQILDPAALRVERLTRRNSSKTEALKANTQPGTRRGYTKSTKSLTSRESGIGGRVASSRCHYGSSQNGHATGRTPQPSRERAGKKAYYIVAKAYRPIDLPSIM